MSVKKVEIQDHEGNIYHPHTDAKVVFTSDGKSVEEKLESLKQSASNGKNIVATAIGTPLLSNDTFTQMGAKIDTLTQTFQNTLTEKGIEVLPNDKMSSLIDKVKSIELGKKWASGDSTPTGSGYNYFINVNNLEFTPKTIFIYGGKGSYYHFNFFTNEIVPSVADGPVLSGFYYGESSVKLYNNSNITINDNSFSAKILNIATQFTNGNYTWLAIE